MLKHPETTLKYSDLPEYATLRSYPASQLYAMVTLALVKVLVSEVFVN